MLRSLRSSYRDYLFIVSGALVQAVGLQLFLVPANLASGGVSGIAQIIHHFTDWPIGVMVLIGNIPLFLIGWRFLGGPRFVARTVTAILAYSIALDLILFLPFFPKDGLTDDIVLNSLYGAVVSGVGYGLVYRGRGTSGGSDILARILNHWRSIPMTQSYLIVDSAVILTAGFVFGWKEALYAIITLYVSGLVAETVLEGGGTVRTVIIITAQPRPIAEAILTQLGRGLTILSGIGAYTGETRSVLYCVITRSEIALLKSIVQETDPKAFMVVGLAHEAIGEGFKELRAEQP